FLTMYWAGSYRQAGPVFFAGLILVIVGVVTVMIFRPHGHSSGETIKINEDKTGVSVDVASIDGGETRHYQAASVEELQTKNPDGFKLYLNPAPLTSRERMFVILFTAMTALCWGVYGPTLHRGQTGMAGSRLRPLICVGLAYFLIAVLVPIALLSQW